LLPRFPLRVSSEPVYLFRLLSEYCGAIESNAGEVIAHWQNLVSRNQEELLITGDWISDDRQVCVMQSAETVLDVLLERILQRFKSAEHALRFLVPFSAVSNHFRPSIFWLSWPFEMPDGRPTLTTRSFRSRSVWKTKSDR
jgi:hypothetical protein